MKSLHVDRAKSPIEKPKMPSKNVKIEADLVTPEISSAKHDGKSNFFFAL